MIGLMGSEGAVTQGTARVPRDLLALVRRPADLRRTALGSMSSAVVADGRIAIEDMRAEPRCLWRASRCSADRIGAPLEDACQMIVEQPGTEPVPAAPSGTRHDDAPRPGQPPGASRHAARQRGPADRCRGVPGGAAGGERPCARGDGRDRAEPPQSAPAHRRRPRRGLSRAAPQPPSLRGEPMARTCERRAENPRPESQDTEPGREPESISLPGGRWSWNSGVTSSASG